MPNPTIGAGFLLVANVLSDVSYALIQNPVNTVAQTGGIAKGSTTVLTYDPGMYVGAQVLVGTTGVDLEVVTITAVNPGVSFTATFSLPHAAGAAIYGPTFPVRQPFDPLVTQAEALAYISTAYSDFLTEVPLLYEIAENITVSYTMQNAALPPTSMFPVRVAAFKYPLRETSIPNLETYDFRWNVQSADTPRAYFRNDNPLQTLGVFPRCNNEVPLEVVYAARGPQLFGLADGFGLPDPFLPIVKWRVLEFMYSKDGEIRQPGLAKFYASRYAFGCKMAQMILSAVNDPNLEMSQG